MRTRRGNQPSEPATRITMHVATTAPRPLRLSVTPKNNQITNEQPNKTNDTQSPEAECPLKKQLITNKQPNKITNEQPNYPKSITKTNNKTITNKNRNPIEIK
jgi:hypothetical protein